MQNRRWAIVAGLGVVEVWIVGLILRSLAGDGHAPGAGVPAPPVAFASSAPAAGTAVQTIDAGAVPSVVIDDDGAALTIIVRSGAGVSVAQGAQRSGWVFGDERPVDIERTSDGVRIWRRCRNVTMVVGSFSRRLEVVVPPQARLDVRNAGSISVAGLRADAKFHSAAGRISVRDHRGDLTVTTDNGPIELSDIEAPAVETTSDEGRISFDRVRAGRVAVRTDAGQIEIERSLLGGGQIETDNGRVALGLDPQSDVTISARTESGKLIAASPLILTAAGDDDEAPRTVRIGNGLGRLDVGSGEGSISIQALGVERS